jgi:hypothetical protein
MKIRNCVLFDGKVMSSRLYNCGKWKRKDKPEF